MTEQDIKRMITSIFYSYEFLNFDNQDVVYKGIKLINSETNKVYKAEEIISDLLKLIDPKKYNFLSEEKLKKLTKSFLDMQMSLTDLYSISNK